jgi:glycosyltransferase involved in cell wall biosynthesis
MSSPLYSIIIPQHNSLHTIPWLLAGIPELEDIEILLADNTPTAVTKEEIGIDRDYNLLWSSPARCACGARNEGIDNTKGDLLIFSELMTSLQKM